MSSPAPLEPITLTERHALDRYDHSRGRRARVRVPLDIMRGLEWGTWGIVRNVGAVGLWIAAKLTSPVTKRLKTFGEVSKVFGSNIAGSKMPGMASVRARRGIGEHGRPSSYVVDEATGKVIEAPASPKPLGRLEMLRIRVGSEAVLASITVRPGRREQLRERLALAGVKR
jgi:hypothetical protein